MKPSASKPNESTSKKPYHRPELQVYGSIADITNTSTNRGAQADAGHAPRTH